MENIIVCIYFVCSLYHVDAVAEKLTEPKFFKFLYRFWFGARVEIFMRT